MLNRSILILQLLILLYFKTNGQAIFVDSIYNLYNSKYEFNQELHTGEKYFSTHAIAKGHPFLYSNIFQTANITYKNKRFNNIKIKYNIYQQKFILGFTNKIGVLQEIILVPSFIDTIFIKNDVFIYNPFPELKNKFIQIISADSISVLFYWYKNFDLKNTTTSAIHEYSKAYKTSYLLINSNIFKFKNNRRFIKYFPLEFQITIKKYIKNNNINIKSADNYEIEKLINYCSTVLNR